MWKKIVAVVLIILATLTISTPVFAEEQNNIEAIGQTPDNLYENDRWSVILQNCDTAENCEYIGYDKIKNNEIKLNNPTVKTSEEYGFFKVYDFTKNNYKYLAMWNVIDYDTLYVVVIDSKRDIVRVLRLYAAKLRDPLPDYPTYPPEDALKQ